MSWQGKCIYRLQACASVLPAHMAEVGKLTGEVFDSRHEMIQTRVCEINLARNLF